MKKFVKETSHNTFNKEIVNKSLVRNWCSYWALPYLIPKKKEKKLV